MASRTHVSRDSRDASLPGDLGQSPSLCVPPFPPNIKCIIIELTSSSVGRGKQVNMLKVLAPIRMVRTGCTHNLGASKPRPPLLCRVSSDEGSRSAAAWNGTPHCPVLKAGPRRGAQSRTSALLTHWVPCAGMGTRGQQCHPWRTYTPICPASTAASIKEGRTGSRILIVGL